MSNENTEVIHVQMDTVQVESSIARIAEVIEELRSVVTKLGEDITTIYDGFLRLPNSIQNLEKPVE